WIWHSLKNGQVRQLTEEVVKLDKENEANGYLAMQLGIMLHQNEVYKESISAFEQAAALNTNQSYQKDILFNKNTALKKLIAQQKPIDQQKALQLKESYEYLFHKYPQLIHSLTYLDYVNVRIIYLNEIDTAIMLLKSFVQKPQLRKDI